jgi:hypothetical protein
MTRIGMFSVLGLLSLVSAGCSSDAGTAANEQSGGSGNGSSSGGASNGGTGGASTGGSSSGGDSSGGDSSGGSSSGGASSGGSGNAGNTGGAGNAGGGGSGGAPGSCGAIPTFADGLSPTKELHVAVGGNDSNSGSASSPLATIKKAADLATPGTAIRIHSGTYPGGTYISGLAGSATAPIWLGGAPGETPPVIQGGGEVIHLTKVRYLVVHDLVGRNTTQNGISIDDGGEYANADATRYVIFQRISVHDVGGSGNQDCLKMSGVNDFWVLDSEFARCGGGTSGSGIDQVGCHHGVVARSSFTDMAGNAVQTKGGSLDVEIKWNLMNNGGARAVNMGGSTGFQYFRPPLSTSSPNYEAKDIRVIANLIIGGAAPLGFVGCVDCLAANNTIIDPTNWLLRILQETVSSGGTTFLPAQNGRFVNNLVYFDRGDLSTYINIGPSTNAPSFQFQNNLWYAHDNPSQSQPSGLPASETGAVVGHDPGFSNPGAGDYDISSSSPAAGKGVPVAGVTGDYDGLCFASAPSIGAFEVQ